MATLPERAQSLDEIVPAVGGRVARKRDMLDVGSLVDELDVSMLEPAAPSAARKGQQRTPAESVAPPAQPMDFDLGGRPIYSSDPAAVPAKSVPLTDAERVELRGMLAEMDAMPFTSHSFVEQTGRGGAMEVVPGGAGAKVYDDVAKVYGRAPGRTAVREAIDKTIAGELSTYGPALREVARQRLQGQAQRQLPPDACGRTACGS